MKHIAKFKAARNAAVPLVIVETPDPNATIVAFRKASNGKKLEPPMLVWDCMRSLKGINKRGEQLAQAISKDDPLTVSSPYDFLNRAYDAVTEVNGKNPTELAEDPDGQIPNYKRAIIFMMNGHLFLRSEQVLQGVWNLRDTYKTIGAMLVILCPTASVPPELQQDVLVISEEYPTQDNLKEMAQSFVKSCNEGGAKITVEEKQLALIGETLTGTSMFSAEQTLAMCTTKDGIDTDMLWDLKCKVVSQTKGLKVWRGGESVKDVRGCKNVIQFCEDIMNGEDPPMAIGFIDEIEKGMAGSKSDTSGTGQDQLQVVLTEMQDSNIPGMLFVGHPGTGKSLIAKCMGALTGIPTISIDFGAMKGSLVGQSEQQIRVAWQVLRAISNGKLLMVATSNGLSSLPPELKRRFYMGTYFFDLPSKEERDDIWKLYIKKMGLKDSAIGFNDNGWTGAEIKACCEIARRTKRPIKEAFKRISPICRTNMAQIEALRREAIGKFISASYEGEYKGAADASVEVQTQTSGRAINLQ